jgi:hypothetical protein
MAKRVPIAATCSECPERLVDKNGNPKPAGTKTCSPRCRNIRARRLKRQRSESGSKSKFDAEVQVIAAAVRDEVKDAAHDVMVEELRPIVREAMTKDVLLGIDSLIKLQPKAVEKLKQQIESADETISQRAVTLLLKYTMGNPSVAPPPTEKAPAAMQVFFEMPRPGDTTVESSQPEDAETLRECLDCHEFKPDGEFVAASDRCTDCFAALRSKVDARFSG